MVFRVLLYALVFQEQRFARQHHHLCLSFAMSALVTPPSCLCAVYTRSERALHISTASDPDDHTTSSTCIGASECRRRFPLICSTK